jgi:hypothetical protein
LRLQRERMSSHTLDEADFWIRDEVDEVRDVAERYIGKSDPYIAMISTPHQPGGLFDRIDRVRSYMYLQTS